MQSLLDEIKETIYQRKSQQTELRRSNYTLNTVTGKNAPPPKQNAVKCTIYNTI